MSVFHHSVIVHTRVMPCRAPHRVNWFFLTGREVSLTAQISFFVSTLSMYIMKEQAWKHVSPEYLNILGLHKIFNRVTAKLPGLRFFLCFLYNKNVRWSFTTTREYMLVHTTLYCTLNLQWVKSILYNYSRLHPRKPCDYCGVNPPSGTHS